MLRFDPEDLRDLAGDRTFERGFAYFREGRVRISRMDARGVAATVSGSEDYRVRLQGEGADVDGDCTCPAYDESGFCKHMVATALAAGSAEGAEHPMAAIRAHLEAQPVAALVALLLEAAENDAGLLRRLELAAVAADPRAAIPTLRRAIDALTRRSRLPDYREVRAWATEVEQVLDAVAALADGPNPAAALDLANHTLDMLGDALLSIDDSSGHGGGLLFQAAHIHRAACERLAPEPVGLARDLFAREMSGDHDTFSGAADVYADLLGAAGRAEYLRLAKAAWDEIPARGPRDQSRPAGSWQLFEILDRFAEADGDLAARIALRTKNLSEPYDYIHLVEFCRANGRVAEALARAEEGLWMLEDRRPDSRLVALAAELLAEAGRPAEAEAHLWRAFAGAPSEELYGRLAALGGDPARERAFGVLEADLAAGRPAPWQYQADLLLRLLLREGRHDRAWAIAARHPVGDGVLEALATATEASHPAEALAAHAERVRRLVQAGGNPAYSEAAAIVARMAGLRPAAEHVTFLADIRTQFARRRNFIKLLDAQPTAPGSSRGRPRN